MFYSIQCERSVIPVKLMSDFWWSICGCVNMICVRIYILGGTSFERVGLTIWIGNSGFWLCMMCQHLDIFTNYHAFGWLRENNGLQNGCPKSIHSSCLFKSRLDFCWLWSTTFFLAFHHWTEHFGLVGFFTYFIQCSNVWCHFLKFWWSSFTEEKRVA